MHTPTFGASSAATISLIRKTDRRKRIGKALFIYAFAVVCGGIIGVTAGVFMIWGVVLAIKLVIPSANARHIVDGFTRPVYISFVGAAVFRCVLSAWRFLRKPDEPFWRTRNDGNPTP